MLCPSSQLMNFAAPGINGSWTTKSCRRAKCIRRLRCTESRGISAKRFYRIVSGKPQCRRASAEPRRYAKAMKDANDGRPWTETDVRGLMAALRVGDTIEEAEEHLCRLGTIKDVRHKAEELGLKYKSRG